MDWGTGLGEGAKDAASYPSFPPRPPHSSLGVHRPPGLAVATLASLYVIYMKQCQPTAQPQPRISFRRTEF